jgi:integrase
MVLIEGEMARKSTKKAGLPVSRTAKIQALADHGSTAGERGAAVAALERILVPPVVDIPVYKPEREALSDAIVRQIPVPKVGSTIQWDATLAGFGVRINASGTRVYFFNYRTKTGRQRRFTIGAYPSWSTGAARIEARRLDRIVDEGGDPLGDLQAGRAAATVDELIERFEKEHLTRRRASTAADYRSMLIKYIKPALGGLKITEVTPTDIDRLHRHITNAGYPYRANRVYDVLSKMFSLARRWDLRKDTPCRGVEQNKEYTRRRYLKEEELVALLKALADYPDRRIADVFRVLLMTGARRGEVLAMRHGDVDLAKGLWSKPPSSSKTKLAHEVPLATPMKQLLTEIRQQQTANRRPLPEYVFPGAGAKGHVVEVKKAWRRICKDAGIHNLRIHDLRHSFASVLVSDGASLPLIGSLLGHTSPATTQRYAHLFDDPQRKAVEHVGSVITAAGHAPPPRSTRSARETPQRKRPIGGAR